MTLCRVACYTDASYSTRGAHGPFITPSPPVHDYLIRCDTTSRAPRLAHCPQHDTARKQRNTRLHYSLARYSARLPLQNAAYTVVRCDALHRAADGEISLPASAWWTNSGGMARGNVTSASWFIHRRFHITRRLFSFNAWHAYRQGMQHVGNHCFLYSTACLLDYSQFLHFTITFYLTNLPYLLGPSYAFLPSSFPCRLPLCLPCWLPTPPVPPASSVLCGT